MTLSKKQLARRQLGVGGSEVGAVVGVKSPGGRTAVDVWAVKRRGPKGEIPPLVAAPPPDADTCDAFAPFIRGDVRTAGNVLEAGIVRLYQMITGAKVTGASTRVHPRLPCMLATPDRYVLGADGLGVERGLEIKLVNAAMAPDWADGCPDYVYLQCMAGMAVTGLDRWDVCALVGGSEPRIHRLERDDGLCHELEEIVGDWWETYVVGDVCPPAVSGDDAIRALRLTWAEDDGQTVEVEPEREDEVEQLVRVYAEARASEKAAEERKKLAAAALAALCGPHYGIRGNFGKAYFGSVKGSPRWKDVAYAMAPDGVVPEALIDEHRATPRRDVKVYPSKRVLAALASERLAEIEEGGES